MNSLLTCQLKNKTYFSVIIIMFLFILLISYATYKTIKREKLLGLRDIEYTNKEIYIIPNFLDNEDFKVMKHITSDPILPLKRRKNLYRSGEAISTEKMKGYPEILNIIRNYKTLKKINEETGMNLSFTPRSDENSISILRYSRTGDGIDKHVDGNIYIGSRWVGLLIVEDDGDSVLKLRDEFIPTQNPNTLILFQGDKIEHAVTRRTRDGNRVLLNILFCDVCSVKTDIISKSWQTLVSNFGFY